MRRIFVVCVCSWWCFTYRIKIQGTMRQYDEILFIVVFKIVISWYTFSKESTLTNYKITKPIEAHLYGIVYRSDMATSFTEHSCFSSTAPSLMHEQHPGLFSQRFGDSLSFVGTHVTNRLEPIDKLVLITVEHLTTERWRQGVMRANQGQTPKKWNMPQTRTGCTTLDNCTNSYLKSSSFLMWAAGSS